MQLFSRHWLVFYTKAMAFGIKATSYYAAIVLGPDWYAI